MSTINHKANPDKTRSLEDERIHYRGAMREAQEVLTLEQHPGWSRLVANFKTRLVDVERQLDGFDKLSDNEIRLLLKERKDFRWIAGVVDKVKEAMPALSDALAQVERQIEERKATSGAPVHS